MKIKSKIILSLLIITSTLSLTGCSNKKEAPQQSITKTITINKIKKDENIIDKMDNEKLTKVEKIELKQDKKNLSQLDKQEIDQTSWKDSPQ